MKLTKKNTVMTAAIVSVSILLSKVFGMLRDIFLAALYGTETVEAIAYSTASRIPLLFFDIALGSAVTSAFIPIYNDILKNKDRKSATLFSNRFITLVTIITSVMVIFGIIFSKNIASIVAGGLNAEQLNLASYLVKILFPIILTTGLSYCAVGILQSEGEFIVPALISLVSNACLILYLIVFKNKFGVVGVAVAMLLSWSLQLFVQLPSLKKMDYKFYFSNPFKDDNIKKVCILALPIIISTWVQPINTMININLASHLNNGAAVTSLDFANKLYIILVGVFAYTVTNITFPSLSKMASSNDEIGYNTVIQKSVKYIMFVILPIMAGFIVLRYPIIKVLYERGAFDATSTYLTSQALLFYSMGMAGFALSEMMNKAFYSLKDGKTPMKISIIGISLNILLSIVFIKIVGTGLEGLAFSASLAANFTGITMLIILNKRNNRKIINKNLIFSLSKNIISSVVMAIFVNIIYTYLLKFNLNKFFQLIIPTSAGIIIYIVLCVILKSEEFYELCNIFINKIKGGKQSEQ
ncbi:MAG: murein biosynthesis integral membrane protein MurJ [Ruminococcaceae bacterium]|nr:murein biosynthesis integral membrane protein MurJ [Oscillospiraceae bacterium]